MRARTIGFETPLAAAANNGATNDGTPRLVSPDANEDTNGSAPTGLGLKDRLEKLGGHSIYAKETILKELEIQNKIFQEKDEEKQEELWAPSVENCWDRMI